MLKTVVSVQKPPQRLFREFQCVRVLLWVEVSQVLWCLLLFIISFWRAKFALFFPFSLIPPLSHQMCSWHQAFFVKYSFMMFSKMYPFHTHGRGKCSHCFVNRNDNKKADFFFWVWRVKMVNCRRIIVYFFRACIVDQRGGPIRCVDHGNGGFAPHWNAGRTGGRIWQKDR